MTGSRCGSPKMKKTQIPRSEDLGLFPVPCLYVVALGTTVITVAGTVVDVPV